VIGFVGIAGLLVLAVWGRSVWTGAVCVFLLINCWNGLQRARALMQLARLPRREGFACPSCRTAPPIGDFWQCGNCPQSFDTFATGGMCPHCGAQYPTTTCMDCRELHPISEWVVGAHPGMGVVSGSFAAK